MTLEQRGERLVITSLPIQDMALLSLGIPLDEPARQVLGALLRGERVAVLAEAMEYRQYKRTAPMGIYQKFVGMERQMREMGIGVIRTSGGPPRNPPP